MKGSHIYDLPPVRAGAEILFPSLTPTLPFSHRRKWNTASSCSTSKWSELYEHGRLLRLCSQHTSCLRASLPSISSSRPVRRFRKLQTDLALFPKTFLIFYSRMVSGCHEKCIDKKYKDGDLNVGENSCVDRCTSKYWQCVGIVGQMLGAADAAAAQTGR